MIVTQITPVSDPHPWENGDRLLAFVNVEHVGIEIRGCLLVRKHNGSNFIHPPKIDGKAMIVFNGIAGRKEAADAAADSLMAQNAE